MAQGQRAGLITPRSLDRNELPVSNPSSHRCIKALEQPLNRYGAAAARRAHNPEVTRSKRVAGMITIQLLCRSSTRLHMDTLNRHGAEEARGAHNSEVTRSKRVAGIHFNLPALQKQAVKLDAKRSWHWYNSEEEVD